MPKNLIVVGARLNSSRLPRKHLLELAGAPLIARIFERISEVDAIAVLATTADPFNRELVQWGASAGIDTVAYQGDVDDLVGRVDRIVAGYDPEYVVYICGDCPLVSPEYIARCLTALEVNPGWDTTTAGRNAAGQRSLHEGILCYSRAGWQRLVDLSRSALTREHVGLALHENSDQFTVGTVYDQPELYGPDIRVSVDTAADWRFMQEVYRRWYQANQGKVSLAWLVQELRRVPLASINSHVMQKQGFRHYGQVLFVTEAGPDKGMGQLVRSVRLAERVCELAGLGVRLWILGAATELGCLRTVNHEWIEGGETELHARLSAENVPPLVVFDLFPERLSQVELMQQALAGLRHSGRVLVGIDRMFQWHHLLELAIVPCLIYHGIRAENIAAGPSYVLAPEWFDEGPKIQGRVLTVMTGGSDAIGYGEWLPGHLDAHLDEGTEVRWVQGPFAAPPVLPKITRLVWDILPAQADIETIARESTLVLSVFGNTVLELLANRIPTILLPAPGLMAASEWQALETCEALTVLQGPEFDLGELNQLMASAQERGQYLSRIDALGLSGGLQRAASLTLDVLLSASPKK